MPAYWSAKDERQYGHVLKTCLRRSRYGKKRCKGIAAGVVNKQRRRERRMLTGLALGGLGLLLRSG